MMRKLFLYLLVPLLALLAACDLEKDIDVELPNHEPQLVVECYLEQGKYIRASVLESSGYFEDPAPPMVPDAEVYITTPAGKRIELKYKPVIVKSTGRFYTHTSTEILSGQPGQTYQLEVVDGKGRRVTGFTKIQPRVPIEEVEWKFNDEEEAYLLTSFQDDANTANYYRYMTHIDSLSGGSDRDFVTSDDLTNGKRVSLGSSYKYREGDTLIVTLYHIEKQYYDFLASISDAKSANGNPFAQPSQINSSVEGGFGIFTNLAYDRKSVVITK
ncbi:DUF4249 domain-containing protein [Pontibacter flavimaris]|uniref:DUF4249 domain-containing protein n=1 Tax=Pontibacter flavimaris TaxID=1797110 RepID=A0A1Q5P9P6_9BACT|nr:DUF4249 domain-containing protein [Pontibacter flavimaris]OKL38862.1 hypothetical protein A3841_04875 [Pontibacter flavimaris]